MKCHRVRRYALGLAGLALIPPLLWIGVVLMAPTAWARRHVVAALEASSGRSVALAGLSVPLLRWSRADGLDVRLAKEHGRPLAQGGEGSARYQRVPSSCRGKSSLARSRSREATLRVLRRADGSLELADFILPPPRETELAAPRQR